MEKRTVEYSKTEQVHLVQPAHLNGGNRLFGGTLLNWIDEVAAIVAMRHAGVKTVTTAAIDQLEFKAGAYINDLIAYMEIQDYVKLAYQNEFGPAHLAEKNRLQKGIQSELEQIKEMIHNFEEK